MENLGYYNGKFGPLEEMMVPMNDRVCYFGDGVYDATYSRNGVIFALDEHIDRFFNSAGLLRIELPCTKDEMKDILNDMVSKVDSGNNFVYWQARVSGKAAVEENAASAQRGQGEHLGHNQARRGQGSFSAH